MSRSRARSALASCTGGGDGVPAPGPGPAPTGAPRPAEPDRAALALGRSVPVEDPYYPKHSNPEIDVLHYFLDLDWDGTVLTGQASVTFRATEATARVRLGLADNLAVAATALDDSAVEHAQADDGLLLETGPLARNSRHILTIDYAGSPEPTPAPSKRADLAAGLGWSVDPEGNVYTFQEPFGAFTWYPVNDHPSDEALYDARITTYDGDTAVFNGELVEQDGRSGGGVTSLWHVDEPMASYVATVAIGPYEEHVVDTPGGFPISYWLLEGDRRLLDPLSAEGGAAFDWLVGRAGRYPFSSLGVVVVGGRSAMETQTMVTMSRGAVQRTDAVLQHEFAHMWFGNSVSPVDWQGMWLNEGWAMYLQQWFETDTGRDVYAGGLALWRGYDNESRRRAGPPGDYDPAWFGDSNVYLGPALMLDEIRQRVGDPTFERMVKTWPAQHENAHVDRADFTAWVNDESGQDLTALIDRWLDSPTTPRR